MIFLQRTFAYIIRYVRTPLRARSGGPLSLWTSFFLEIFSCVRNCDCNSLIPVMFNKKRPLPFVGFAESLGVGLTFPHAFIYLDISGKICE